MGYWVTGCTGFDWVQWSQWVTVDPLRFIGQGCAHWSNLDCSRAVGGMRYEQYVCHLYLFSKYSRDKQILGSGMGCDMKYDQVRV